jgi:hypothetical protein
MSSIFRRTPLRRVGPVHRVAILVGHHLERQLVVVAQERRPLARVRDLRRASQDVDDREAVLELDRHEHPGHQREVEVHVALVAVAEVRRGVRRPLVGLREQHPVLEVGVDVRAQLLEERVGLLEVLAARSLALVEVRHRVEPHAVDAHLHPEVDHPEQRGVDGRVVEVEIGLVRVEPVPVVRLRDRIPRPVRALVVLEDDAGVLVARRGVAPHVEVALGAARRRAAGALEPRVL